MPACGAEALDQDGELHRCCLPTENRDPRFRHTHYCGGCNTGWEDRDVHEGRFFSVFLEAYRARAIPFYEKGHCAGIKK